LLIIPGYTPVDLLSVADVWGGLLGLPTNTRLGGKGLPGTNAHAYYEKAYLMAVKSFITLATTPFSF